MSTAIDYISRPRAIPRWLAVLRWLVLATTATYLINASFWGLTGPVRSVGFVGIGLGMAVVSVLWLASRTPLPLWSIGILSAGAGIAWGLLTNSTPTSDFGNFYDAAASFATSGDIEYLWGSKSPTTILYFGTWMAITETSVASARIAGSLALGIGAFSTAALASTVGFTKPESRLAGLLLGLSPGLVAFSPLVSSEVVLVATVMPGLALYAAGRRTAGNRRGVSMIVGAVLLSLSYLANPTGAFFAVGVALMALYDWTRAPRSRNGSLVLVTTILALGVAPTAQVAMNVAFDNNWSISSRKAMGLGLLNGTSVECSGRWCPNDLDLARFDENGVRVSQDEANARATAIAVQRWTDDPVGLAAFGLSTKVRQVWRDETHMLAWQLRESPVVDEWEDRGFLPVVESLVDGYFMVILGLTPFSIAVLAVRRRPLPAEAVVASIGMLGSGLVYFLMVVQQRYHVAFLPFVMVLIATALTAQEKTERKEKPDHLEAQ